MVFIKLFLIEQPGYGLAMELRVQEIYGPWSFDSSLWQPQPALPHLYLRTVRDPGTLGPIDESSDDISSSRL
ncbi:MAG: hypothetical protein HKL84_03690 [Acidimicrobiaceae bacterium]|nr:hypothetical protein [Acidimicrobiaceae bacterium]